MIGYPGARNQRLHVHWHPVCGDEISNICNSLEPESMRSTQQKYNRQPNVTDRKDEGADMDKVKQM